MIGHLKPCRRCHRPTPPELYLLTNNPTAQARRYVTRHWCGHCTTATGHTTKGQLARALAELERQAADRQAEKDASILVKCALDDPRFDAALTRAFYRLHPAEPTRR